MRHLKRGRKFGRSRNQRKALLRNLAVALVDKHRITTTEAKAKELRHFFESAISDGKAKNVTALRKLRAKLSERSATKIINDLSKRFASRGGGYTRIIRVGNRKSDSAKMAIIELVE